MLVSVLLLSTLMMAFGTWAYFKVTVPLKDLPTYEEMALLKEKEEA